MKVGEYIIERMMEWGVTRIFGYPGDAINGITAGLEKNADKISFVQARHEEMAAFMATAHAKFTGEVGVCLVTSGPGAIHTLNGLYDAKLDNQPVVAIVGQQARKAIGTDFMQEVDLTNLFKDVASPYVHIATTPAQVRHLIDRAFRIAKSQRCVTCIVVPADLQSQDAAPHPKREHGQSFSGVGYAAPRVVPQSIDLRRAAEVLNSGKKVAMLIGAGCLGATDEVIAVADKLQAGVAKALLGKAVLPDDLSYVTGAIGLLGTRPSWDLMQKCDTLLMVGTNFPYAEFLPKEGQARGVQIDIQPENVSLRYPMEVNLIGDARETLLELLPLLEQKSERSWRDEIEGWTAEWWKVVEARAKDKASQDLNPQAFFWHINNYLPDDSIIVADCGTSTVWMARDIKIRRGMMATTSGGLATMGNGVPYAIGAKFAYPDRPVFAIVGDGAMQMNGNGELVTIAKYYGQWSSPSLVIVVLNNRDLSFVTWEQRGKEGMPRSMQTQPLPDFNYAEYARNLGLGGIRVDSYDQMGTAWQTALHADRPTIIDLLVDPNIPPLPPHISKKETDSFLTSLKSDHQRSEMIFDSLRQMASSMFPGWTG